MPRHTAAILKARTERDGNDLRGAGLFRQYHHTSIINMISLFHFWNITVIVIACYRRYPYILVLRQQNFFRVCLDRKLSGVFLSVNSHEFDRRQF